MESPREPDEAGQQPQPTKQDRENERIRQAIAVRFAEEYGKVLGWAMGLFGPGFEPSHRHFLVDKAEERRCRHTGERPPEAATVYSVVNAEDQQRHFTVGADGKVTEVAGYEEGFGEMMNEKHPTEGFDHKGRFIRAGKYSLCWSSIETYHPKSADQLAKLRETRERNREERADAKFIEENPLLAQAGIKRQDIE